MPRRQPYRPARPAPVSMAWAKPTDINEVSPATPDISSAVLDGKGRFRIMPAAFWAGTTAPERALFGHRNGIYSFQTTELVDCLSRIIGTRTAIEIGAGNGVLAATLGIPATDSRQQELRRYRRWYEENGWPIVPYGRNIVKMDAHTAVRHYQPRVVVACFVTHRWNPMRPFDEGNEIGVDEGDVIDNCDTYIFVGNEKTHKRKPIWKRPHTIEYPPWLYSRAALNGTRDFIAVWQRDSAT